MASGDAIWRADFGAPRAGRAILATLPRAPCRVTAAVSRPPRSQDRAPVARAPLPRPPTSADRRLTASCPQIWPVAPPPPAHGRANSCAVGCHRGALGRVVVSRGAHGLQRVARAARRAPGPWCRHGACCSRPHGRADVTILPSSRRCPARVSAPPRRRERCVGQSPFDASWHASILTLVDRGWKGRIGDHRSPV